MGDDPHNYFRAAFNGKCAKCEKAIHTGEYVTYSIDEEGQIICPACADEELRPE
jgi:NAD-dependent SIR2 family protein deacetylase